MKSPDEKRIKSSFLYMRKDSWGWKVALGYDIFMMALIVINLFCLSANAILMSDFGQWLFDFILLPEVLSFYKSDLRPWVIITEGWFTTFLIVELCIRWGIAIALKHHQRWWFFPFIHWYEIVSILPQFRFLRLLRAIAIGYNLYSHGYQIFPTAWIRRGNFYYNVIMEELTSRIVLTVLKRVEHQIEDSRLNHQLVDQLIEQHRKMLKLAIADVLEQSLGQELQQQRGLIAKNVGQVVNQAIEDTPELTQLLRLIPIVGGRIEQQIQSIGQRLGENITQGLIEPFAHEPSRRKNQMYELIATRVSELELEHNAHVEALVQSAIRESLNAIKAQVQVKKWQQVLAEHDQAKE